jgi:hypothetical protein
MCRLQCGRILRSDGRCFCLYGLFSGEALVLWIAAPDNPIGGGLPCLRRKLVEKNGATRLLARGIDWGSSVTYYTLISLRAQGKRRPASMNIDHRKVLKVEACAGDIKCHPPGPPLAVAQPSAMASRHTRCAW